MLPLSPSRLMLVPAPLIARCIWASDVEEVRTEVADLRASDPGRLRVVLYAGWP